MRRSSRNDTELPSSHPIVISLQWIDLYYSSTLFVQGNDMAQPNVTRRLAAIFAVDMVGYSRLMEVDEEATIARQKALRAELIDPTIAEYRGRIVKLMGDGALVEFASVVDAVQCAVAVQKGMAGRENEVPEDRRIRYRIGINLGDIVIDGDDILGDGVNVAARLEGLAEPGGICIPRKVFHEVRNKLDVGYAFIGEQKVKNIETPIPVYRVLLAPDAAGQVIGERRPSQQRGRFGAVAAIVVFVIAASGLAWWQPWVTRVEPASIENFAFPLPDRPSIAVLPFVNLTGDASQDYLGDGIADNITTALSRLPDIFVIARTSTLPYKGKPVKVQQVAEELGVRHVLEGSVQTAGEQVRVTAQLIDALSGRQIWAERYERELKDTFVLQDDITLNVLISLELKLTEGGRARIFSSTTNNLDAYQLARRGFPLFLRFTEADNAEARRLFQKAVELDPNYAFGWHSLGLTHQMAASFGWGGDPAQEEARAEQLAHKAIAIDPSFGGPYNLLANLALHRRDYDEAIAHGEKAVALSPNSASLLALLGRTLTFAGRPNEALPLIQRGIRLNPNTPPNLLRFEGQAYHAMERYEEAIAAFERARARNPKSPLPLVFLALTYADMGRIEDARAVAQQAVEVNPGFSAKGFVNAHLNYQDRTVPERALATLRQLGLTKNQPAELTD